MSKEKAASWVYAESSVHESELVARSRAAAQELGISTLSPASCALLASLAALPHVRTIAEVGTGAGTTAITMLEASPKASVTTIDVDAEAQSRARAAFESMGIGSSRYRLINGRSADLLPRLAGSAYDLVLIDGDLLEAAGDVEEALRILRPGGMLVLAHALYEDRVANPVCRDEVTVAMRNLGTELLASEQSHASLLPLGDGIIFATKAS
ncbi:MAG: class I SAM-dependent methyltransferase [Actinomycetaceae bacterium]|nr:class I SAM-dependent methyltransferase [Arcanobacterium sp.]MDD7504352.1 class I SAM-dependent methyltransferase [Actinomycetaceae bacterium]